MNFFFLFEIFRIPSQFHDFAKVFDNFISGNNKYLWVSCENLSWLRFCELFEIMIS